MVSIFCRAISFFSINWLRSPTSPGLAFAQRLILLLKLLAQLNQAVQLFFKLV